MHVDHGLRPGSADEADVVAAAAAALRRRVPGRAGRRRADGPDLEARARAARRAVLGPDACTGHTLDDRAETVVLNLLRGAGHDRALAGSAPGPRHPILGPAPERDPRPCARPRASTPVEDPTNADPALPSATGSATRCCRCWPTSPGGTWCRCWPARPRCWPTTPTCVAALAAELDVTDARALAAAPVALARAAVRAWLRPTAAGQPPSAAAVERVLAVARGEVVACEVAGGWRVQRSAGVLSLRSPR